MTQVLPREIPLFPLGGAILLPGEVLPLNVFEPRYLNMVDDALKSDRMIGIVQTRPGGATDHPDLETIGAAGRIGEHSETPDGRYLITLEGISRFRLTGEADRPAPYRTGVVDYAGFAADLDVPETLLDTDRERLESLLRLWFANEHVETDWDSVAAAPLARVVDRMAMVAPFSASERQRLLEARHVRRRLDVMSDILEHRIAEGANGSAN